MKAILMTYELAMACSRDSANRRMRKQGRTTWNKSDWNHACEVFEKIYGTDHEKN